MNKNLSHIARQLAASADTFSVCQVNLPVQVTPGAPTPAAPAAPPAKP